MTVEYKIDDLVWAKMKGFPWWPGQVSPPVAYLKNPPKKSMLCIFFFGTNNYAWIDPSNLKPYLEHKGKLQSQSKLSSFKRAVKAIETFLTEAHNDVTSASTPAPLNDQEDELAQDAAIIQNATKEINKKKTAKRLNTSKSATASKRRKLDEPLNGSNDLTSNELALDNEPPKVAVTAPKKTVATKKSQKDVVAKQTTVVAKSIVENEDVDNETAENTERWDSPKNSTEKFKVVVKKNYKVHRLNTAENFLGSYFKHLSIGYNTLLQIFKYLNVQDLLRASQVCSMWRDLSKHPMLWRHVHLKQFPSKDMYNRMSDVLNKCGTTYLDMHKVIVLEKDLDEDISGWSEFLEMFSNTPTLRKIRMCQCPTRVVEEIVNKNRMLQEIIANELVGDKLSLDNFSDANALLGLRLKSSNGFELEGKRLGSLEALNHLRSLSLTSVSNLNTCDLNALENLTELERLELGECTNMPVHFGTEILPVLKKLTWLRLEKGQGNCHVFEILAAVKDIPNLQTLELVNFDIKVGFDRNLGACTNLRRLLIIPTYVSQSATTNHMVLGGILRLRKTLTQFVWGITLELLRVTDLFIGQYEEHKEIKTKGESIPVLKPIPSEDTLNQDTVISDPPDVDILPLPNLQKLLLSYLPSTSVKILKIPFSATWWQTISESN